MRWLLSKEKQRGVERFVIRRWNGDKLERLPVEKFRRIRDDFEALSELVKRLNAPIDLKVKVDFKHAFINDHLLADYLEDLKADIPDEHVASTELSYLKHYVLHYFITLQGVIDPARWIDLDKKWINYLLSNPKGPKGIKLKGVQAETTKRKVVNAANRFIAWLHKKRPEEIPAYRFPTISKARFKQIKAQRRLDGDTKDHVYIPKDDLKIIVKNLPDYLEPFVMLMLRYGLRRNESLGVLPGDVKKGHLFVQRQFKRMGKYAPLKGKDVRKVNHWFNTASEAYAWVEEVQKHRVHSRTLHQLWDEYRLSLGMDYTFHDLRHTWTTDAMRRFGKEAPRDVQLAAGHKNLMTTMGYLHDDRDMSDEEFVPGVSA